LSSPRPTLQDLPKETVALGHYFPARKMLWKQTTAENSPAGKTSGREIQER